MLMQCAITSGLRRPRNLSLSRRPPGSPAFCRKGGEFSTWGGGGGGEAEGKAAGCLGSDAGCGALSLGGSGREKGRAGQREGESLPGSSQRGPQHN